MKISSIRCLDTNDAHLSNEIYIFIPINSQSFIKFKVDLEFRSNFAIFCWHSHRLHPIYDIEAFPTNQRIPYCATASPMDSFDLAGESYLPKPRLLLSIPNTLRLTLHLLIRAFWCNSVTNYTIGWMQISSFHRPSESYSRKCSIFSVWRPLYRFRTLKSVSWWAMDARE